MKQQDIILKLKNIKVAEVLEREVATFGTGCHIIVPQKHKNKKAVVIIKDE